MSDEPKSKYWICPSCAKDQGLEAPEFAVTIILGTCGHCELPVKQPLTPVCDYRDPKTNREPVWD